MTKLFKPLTTDIELYTAAIEKRTVGVFIGKERIGRGIMSEITEVSVKIEGERFMRANCSFWIEED